MLKHVRCVPVGVSTPRPEGLACGAPLETCTGRDQHQHPLDRREVPAQKAWALHTRADCRCHFPDQQLDWKMR